MKASDLLVKCLETEGITHIFGVPGEENADFMMSLEASDKIRFILTRHEQGAAFMAEVYGRLTHNPAGCLGTLGPGATNLITGVADGNMDRAPMLVLTGQGSTRRLHKESHQVMDVVEMFRPVTKWAASIRHPDNIPEMVRKAVRIARTEKPGAVHLELPEDIAQQPSDASPISPQRFSRPIPARQQITQVMTMILQSKRPIILAGNGCIRLRAAHQLRRFCELTDIGVVSTFMAKGCVDMDDSHCLFTVGLGQKDITNCALDGADLVLTVGYDMVEYHPSLWNPSGDKPIIHADYLPTEIDEHYQPKLELIGDLAHTLDMLCDMLQQNPGYHCNREQQLATRRMMLDEFERHKNDATEGSIRPQKVLSDVRSAMGPQDILLSDVGAHKMWIARHYQCHEPNTCLIPNGFCSMGFGLPGAIGAGLVYPEKRIMAICGDAGFLMNVQEMETAHRLKSPIVVMVWEDNMYGLIAWKQQNHFGRHTKLDFGNPDWKQLAQAFGWHGHLVNRSRDLKDVLDTAFNETGPSLIVIPIDYSENLRLTESLGQVACPI